jgi:hypothetical protein
MRKSRKYCGSMGPRRDLPSDAQRIRRRAPSSIAGEAGTFGIGGPDHWRKGTPSNESLDLIGAAFRFSVACCRCSGPTRPACAFAGLSSGCVMEQPHATTSSDWVGRVFDHPVMDHAWHWDIGADTSEPAASDCVAHLTRLFDEPELALAPYSDAQIGQGLWYLVDNSCPNYMFSLIEPEVVWPRRQQGIRAIGSLFERLFAPRCSDHLSHRDEQGANPLNAVCYMWWDIFPAYGRPNDPVYAGVDAEVLTVMKRVLSLSSPACQESALHGLGHWQGHYPGVVEQAINQFLTRSAGLRPELREYALSARWGRVL